MCWAPEGAHRFATFRWDSLVDRTDDRDHRMHQDNRHGRYLYRPDLLQRRLDATEDAPSAIAGGSGERISKQLVHLRQDLCRDQFECVKVVAC